MKPRSAVGTDQRRLFEASLDRVLDPTHPLVVLADRIDWQRLDAALADCYCPDNGAPAKATRLLVGLHYLKHAYNESDESVLARWLENPYWQYFCGYTIMQHTLPLHPTSLVKWRKRVGAERMQLLLRETIALAVGQRQISPQELEQVNVDTTVQEKNVAHPTDSKLYCKAIVKLARAAKARGIGLRQTYLRVAKRAAVKAGRYAHAKQYRRMRRELRFLHTRLGRLIRELHRKVSAPDAALANLLALCERLHRQQPHDRGKLYSLHEPEVVCISKGKAHKRYEFGQKVSVITSNRGNWVLGVELCAGNPYDGHTLSLSLNSAERNTGIPIRAAYVDRGYRGHDYRGGAAIHLAGGSTRHLTRMQRQRRRRRSAVEPKIGHLKSDHRMARCFLSGLLGDAINAILAAAGANLRKLLRGLLFTLMHWLTCLAPHGEKTKIGLRPAITAH